VIVANRGIVDVAVKQVRLDGFDAPICTPHSNGPAARPAVRWSRSGWTRTRPRSARRDAAHGTEEPAGGSVRPAGSRARERARLRAVLASSGRSRALYVR
jgi:hypothetical protein